MRHRLWHALKVFAFGLAFGSSIALAAPEVGWWWNPAESGRGFFVESQGGIFYMAGYFYDVDGRPTWLVAGGPNADPYSFNGQLQSYVGGQTLFGAYKPPTGPVDGGAVSVRFTDDRHGTLTWPGGTIAIERHVFGATEPAFQPLSGWWWNPAESGRGFSIELQGDTLFVASFMYDDAGKPVWYISAGPMSSPTHYEGPWRRYANGQTMSGSYHPPDAPVSVGTLAIDFSQADKATMSVTPIASAATQSARATADAISPLVWPIEREFAPEYEVARHYDVRFTYKAVLSHPSTPTTYTVTGVVSFDAIPEDLNPLTPSKLKGSTRYLPTLDPSAKTVVIEYRASLNSGGLQCQYSGSKTAALPPGTYELEVSKYGPYVGNLVVPKIPFPFTGQCTAGGLSFAASDEDDGLVLHMPLLGSLLFAAGAGRNPIGPDNVHSWTWALVRGSP